MSISIQEVVKSIRASQTFAEFFEGVEFSDRDGGLHTVKITGTSRSQRLPGYRFMRYSFMATAETSGGQVKYGYGESDAEILALQKSIAEAIERTIFSVAAELDPALTTTNGWAAHLTIAAAEKSARRELFERDAILIHWLSEIPPYRIENDTLPRGLRSWVKAELAQAPRYNQASFFLSYLGEVPAVSAFVHDAENFGFFAHASGDDPKDSIGHALAEACRLADLNRKGFLESEKNASGTRPEDHALHFAKKSPPPDFFFSGKMVSYRECRKLWKTHLGLGPSISDLRFEHYQCGGLHIARCISSQVQNLYFGEAGAAIERGDINFSRIHQLTGVKRLCLLPHSVA